MADVALGTPLGRIRTQLDDPDGQRFDDPYIINFCDQCNEDLVIEFAAKGLEYGEQVLEITSVAANTLSLATQQAVNGVLQYMILPISLEWKDAGQDAINYKPVPRVDKIADVQSTDGVVNWEFRSGVVYLTPSTGIVDLRIRFFGMPSTSLANEQSTVNRSMVNVFVYKVAQQIASRNGSEQLAADLKDDLWRAQENLEELLTKQDQAVDRRFGRQNPVSSGGNFRIPTV